MQKDQHQRGVYVVSDSTEYTTLEIKNEPAYLALIEWLDENDIRYAILQKYTQPKRVSSRLNGINLVKTRATGLIKIEDLTIETLVLMGL